MRLLRYCVPRNDNLLNVEVVRLLRRYAPRNDNLLNVEVVRLLRYCVPRNDRVGDRKLLKSSLSVFWEHKMGEI